MKDSLTSIDPEQLESNLSNAYKTIHKCLKHFKDVTGCLDVAADVKRQIEAFKPYVPLVQGLRNPGMRQRHWEQLSQELGFPVSLVMLIRLVTNSAYCYSIVLC